MLKFRDRFKILLLMTLFTGSLTGCGVNNQGLNQLLGPGVRRTRPTSRTMRQITSQFKGSSLLSHI